MNLNALIFLNEKNLQTGIKVKFKEIETPQGKGMSFTNDKGERFVIKASLENFNRFQKWNDKTSMADILVTNKSVKTKEGKFPLVKIRTDIEIKDEDKSEHDQDETVF